MGVLLPLQELCYSFWENIAALLLQPDLSSGVLSYRDQAVHLHQAGEMPALLTLSSRPAISPSCTSKLKICKLHANVTNDLRAHSMPAPSRRAEQAGVLRSARPLIGTRMSVTEPLCVAQHCLHVRRDLAACPEGSALSRQSAGLAIPGTCRPAASSMPSDSAAGLPCSRAICRCMPGPVRLLSSEAMPLCMQSMEMCCISSLGLWWSHNAYRATRLSHLRLCSWNMLLFSIQCV